MKIVVNVCGLMLGASSEAARDGGVGGPAGMKSEGTVATVDCSYVSLSSPVVSDALHAL